MLVFIAFAVDIGYMQLAKSQLQRTADSAAMAATWSLVQPATSTGTDMTSEISLARSQAVSFAAKNNVLAVAAPVVDSNTSNSSTGDVVVGYLSDPTNSTCVMDTTQ